MLKQIFEMHFYKILFNFRKKPSSLSLCEEAQKTEYSLDFDKLLPEMLTSSDAKRSSFSSLYDAKNCRDDLDRQKLSRQWFSLLINYVGTNI